MYSSVQSESVKAYVDLDLLSDMSDDELLQTLAQRPDSLHRVPHTGSKLLANTSIHIVSIPQVQSESPVSFADNSKH